MALNNPISDFMQQVQALIDDNNMLKSKVADLEMRVKNVESNNWEQQNDILSINEVMKLSGKSKRTIYRKIGSGCLLATKGIDGRWRFNKEDVRYFIKRNTKF